MKIFKHNNRSNGKRRGKDFNDRNSGRPSMHKTTCSECGKNCEVPFKPTGDKPVFCSECFGNKGGGNARRSDNRRNSGRSNYGEKRMHRATCDSCGNNCEVPFRPTGNKPIYCDNCFGKGKKSNTRGDNQSRPQTSSDNKQLEMINNKLDKILKALGNNETDVKTDIIVAKPKKVASKPKSTTVKKKATKKTVTKKKVKKAAKPKTKKKK